MMEREKGVAIDDGGGGGGDDVRGEGNHQLQHKHQQEQELLGAKLRRGISIGKRGGPCTPVPSWKLEPSSGGGGGGGDLTQHHHQKHPQRHRSSTSTVSARKLGANLWEIQDLLPVSEMSRIGARARHHRDEEIFDLADLSPHFPHDQPQSAGSLRRHIEASFLQHHKPANRNGRALQPVSPASYSSMEVAAYNQAMTPTSSLDLKGKVRGSGYNLKTSTELLKVLNRIWSLEEQHASNMSLVKALKLELDHARARIQELIQEQQADRHEIDDLLKQVDEDKYVRKSRERERIKAAVQSVKDELEDERRLRRHSEKLHRKLAKELSETKSSYSRALQDLERERKARTLLEDLCDEFAKGIGDYEQEVRELKQKSEKDYGPRCDRLVLHISEAWLDERLQMKLAEGRGDLEERNSIVDRLGCEVETFLHARRTNTYHNNDTAQRDAREDNYLHRQSLESVHFNGAVSAPQDAEDEDSIGSDLHCFELNMGPNGMGHDNFKKNSDKETGKSEEARISNSIRKKIGYFERIHAHHKTQNGDVNQFETVTFLKSQNHEVGENGQDMKVKLEGMHGLGHVISDSTRGQSDFSDSKIHPETGHEEDSSALYSSRGKSVTVGTDDLSGDFHYASSPVQQWNFRHSSPDIEIAESSSKLPQGFKENTLKAKLLEARLEGQNARLRTSKGPSFCG